MRSLAIAACLAVGFCASCTSAGQQTDELSGSTVFSLVPGPGQLEHIPADEIEPGQAEKGFEHLLDFNEGIDEIGEAIVGQDIENARSWAALNDHVIRVVKRDGESLPVTLGFNQQRINVIVVDNLVVEVDGLG